MDLTNQVTMLIDKHPRLQQVWEIVHLTMLV